MCDFYVLCAPSVIVPGEVVSSPRPDVVHVQYVYQKVEHMTVYVKDEEYTPDVTIWVCQQQQHGHLPRCMLPLPSPYNNKLRYGSSLLFQVPFTTDFVLLWNTAVAKSVTWKHVRPKKVNDPLQKLGLPPRLHEHLREQLLAWGLDAPVLSDDDQNVVDGSKEENALSSEFDSSDCESSVGEGGGVRHKEDDDEESYYTGMEEEDDVEEEEEVEEEELDEPDYIDD